MLLTKLIVDLYEKILTLVGLCKTWTGWRWMLGDRIGRWKIANDKNARPDNRMRNNERIWTAKLSLEEIYFKYFRQEEVEYLCTEFDHHSKIIPLFPLMGPAWQAMEILVRLMLFLLR